jgi:hypothetical protein
MKATTNTFESPSLICSTNIREMERDLPETWINPRDNSVMRLIPVGEFIMGSTPEQIEAARLMDIYGINGTFIIVTRPAICVRRSLRTATTARRALFAAAFALAGKKFVFAVRIGVATTQPSSTFTTPAFAARAMRKSFQKKRPNYET